MGSAVGPGTAVDLGDPPGGELALDDGGAAFGWPSASTPTMTPKMPRPPVIRAAIRVIFEFSDSRCHHDRPLGAALLVIPPFTLHADHACRTRALPYLNRQCAVVGSLLPVGSLRAFSAYSGKTSRPVAGYWFHSAGSSPSAMSSIRADGRLHTACATTGQPVPRDLPVPSLFRQSLRSHERQTAG